MGYTTDFSGSFRLNKKLDKQTHEFLNKLATTRRMARNVDPKYGVEGEFYVDGKDSFGQGQEDNIIDYNRPPKTQPGLWCQWIPDEEGKEIGWDGGEKFYNYVEWIEYIIEKILKPKDYVLNGDVYWSGEETSDTGKISIEKNNVTAIATGEYETMINRIVAVKDLRPLIIGIHPTLDKLIEPKMKGRKK
jgi:hypothetical protein